MPDAARVRASPLDRDLDIDVAIVGAGLTGLWTAYHLAGADPSLRIAVVERERIGFGASGRNGGWCSGLLPGSLRVLARRYGRAPAIAMQRVMHGAVDDVLTTVAHEGFDVEAAKGGTVTVARTVAQQERLAAELAESRDFGFGDADLRWLEDGELAARCGVTGAQAALFSPHCAALHPLRLVHAVAAMAQRRGVTVYERTAAVDWSPGQLSTDRGALRAKVVVLATEAWMSARMSARPDRRRSVVPLYSLMVGTDPLQPEQWDRMGLARRETFHDARHLIIYGQRTADGRLAFGGRGAPYHFGSRIDTRFDTDERVRAMLIATLGDLFPALADVDVPYHWGGPLGVPRDWQWSAVYDRSAGLAWAGGYVGDGVSTTYVAGRTLAELITGHDSELTRLPWAGHHTKRWEPEPLRWLGINLGRHAAARADAAETSDSRWARPRAKAWTAVLNALTRH